MPILGSIVIIGPGDLAPFAEIEPVKAQAMIDDALAMAAQVAPCLAQPGFQYAAAARAILRGAILRWNDSGSGAVTSTTSGPFSQTIDNRSNRRTLFWPSEIEQLQKLCAVAGSGGAFSVDTVPTATVAHADICSINFGATYCSCGALLTGLSALWEDAG